MTVGRELVSEEDRRFHENRYWAARPDHARSGLFVTAWQCSEAAASVLYCLATHTHRPKQWGGAGAGRTPPVALGQAKIAHLAGVSLRSAGKSLDGFAEMGWMWSQDVGRRRGRKAPVKAYSLSYEIFGGDGQGIQFFPACTLYSPDRLWHAAPNAARHLAIMLRLLAPIRSAASFTASLPPAERSHAQRMMAERAERGHVSVRELADLSGQGTNAVQRHLPVAHQLARLLAADDAARRARVLRESAPHARKHT